MQPSDKQAETLGAAPRSLPDRVKQCYSCPQPWIIGPNHGNPASSHPDTDPPSASCTPDWQPFSDVSRTVLPSRDGLLMDPVNSYRTGIYYYPATIISSGLSLSVISWAIPHFLLFIIYRSCCSICRSWESKPPLSALTQKHTSSARRDRQLVPRTAGTVQVRTMYGPRTEGQGYPPPTDVQLSHVRHGCHWPSVCHWLSVPMRFNGAFTSGLYETVRIVRNVTTVNRYTTGCCRWSMDSQVGHRRAFTAGLFISVNNVRKYSCTNGVRTVTVGGVPVGSGGNNPRFGTEVHKLAGIPNKQQCTAGVQQVYGRSVVPVITYGLTHGLTSYVRIDQCYRVYSRCTAGVQQA